MRFADILIDLAAVVKASRSVASRHIELRARQFDRYGQTSSIVRSLRETQSNARPSRPEAANTAGPSVKSEENLHEAVPHPDVVTPASEDIKSETKDSTLNSLQNDSQKSHGDPADFHRNLFQRSSLNDTTATQHPSALRVQSDQSAILAQLRKSANDAKERHDIESSVSFPPDSSKPSAPSAPPTQEDVPPDVNVNVFRTNRGTQILEGKKDALRTPTNQFSVLVSSPGWFKDFGHGNSKPHLQETKPSPPIAESAATQGAPTANEIATHAAIDKDEPDTKEETPRQEADKETSTQTLDKIVSKAEIETKTEAPPGVATETETMFDSETSKPAYSLKESRVPSTRLGRLWNYGGLAAGMLGGAISEGLSRGLGGGGEGSVLFSPGNMERLVTKLSRMRGAALKIGQVMSFQDSKMLPGPIREVLQRVQDRADYMPAWQRDNMLSTSLGPEWRNLFDEFEETPIAAASIGQVHRATLKSTGEKVAVKIQFPGVADSINSDLDNLSMLLTASKLLPKGLYLNKTIDNARTELAWECDYEREAECGRRYRALLADEPDVFVIPKIHAAASGKRVLTMEFMEGIGVTRGKSFTQEQKDWIGTQILRLCLREITEFRFMQTDPNWTNFLYNAATNKLELLDFGASREFPERFVAQYVRLLAAAARSDRRTIKELSERLGYLTGHESKTMLDAHIASILTLAEPFSESAPRVYDFQNQTITDRVKALIPVMIRERLSPPPEETYSLHRKLSGAFLLCARLGSRVPCRELFEQALGKMNVR
ncbi:ABC1-domain-containing protein [Rostrohypoxylon terebratum]|nr:ABC1-domain-containing protein [Rostrohypoxylon terebratum]